MWLGVILKVPAMTSPAFPAWPICSPRATWMADVKRVGTVQTAQRNNSANSPLPPRLQRLLPSQPPYGEQLVFRPHSRKMSTSLPSLSNTWVNKQRVLNAYTFTSQESYFLFSSFFFFSWPQVLATFALLPFKKVTAPKAFRSKLLFSFFFIFLFIFEILQLNRKWIVTTVFLLLVFLKMINSMHIKVRILELGNCHLCAGDSYTIVNRNILCDQAGCIYLASLNNP